MTGSDYERRFARMFAQTDHWHAQRAAASGSATDADLPDLTFASETVVFCAELKTTSSPYIYVDEDEVEALDNYAEAYGGWSVILGRFKGERAYYAWNPADMERTDSGAYRGVADDGNWAAKIAEPDSSADGIEPADLGPFHLRHALAGRLGKGITEPPKNGPVVSGGGD